MVLIERGIQNQLLYERSGYTAKKKVKNANRELIRDDWEDFMADWMLYVIWTKCRGNKDFADKLKSIPRDAIIMENSTTIHEGTSVYWGSKNKELEEAREKVARYTELQYFQLDLMLHISIFSIAQIIQEPNLL